MSIIFGDFKGCKSCEADGCMKIASYKRCCMNTESFLTSNHFIYIACLSLRNCKLFASRKQTRKTRLVRIIQMEKIALEEISYHPEKMH